MHTVVGVGGARWVSPVRARRVALCLLLALSGCASPPPPPKPTTLKATLQVAANSNPDASRRASPLVLRVYELKSSAAFDSADFLSIYDRDQATLGAEVAGREEFVLRPGDNRLWEKPTGNDVRFVGVLAAFRDIERARWKALVPVKPNATNVITIKVDGISLSAVATAQ